MKQFMVRMPDERHKRLKLHAVHAEKGMNEIINELVEEYLERVEKKKPKP